MVITIKLCQVVWNVYDFRNKHEKFAHRAENAIDIKKLSLLSLMSYVFFFPSFMAGPAYEYQRYMRFTEMRGGKCKIYGFCYRSFVCDHLLE